MEIVEEKYQSLRIDVTRLGFYERSYVYYVCYASLVVVASVACFFFITLSGNIFFQLANALLLGFVTVQAGMLGHDLAHLQVFASVKKNDLVGMFVWGLFAGFSESKWYDKHIAHHRHPNQIGQDPDLNIPFVFSKEQVPSRSQFFKTWILPHQHVLFFLALPFLYFDNILRHLCFIAKHLSLRTSLEFLLMSARFLLLFYFSFGYLPFSVALAFLAVHFGVVGIYMSLVFAPNHKGERVLRENETFTWLDQITSTRNIYPSAFIFHLFGGLNFQIEHHLFSNVARPYYPKLHLLVKKFCREHAISYHETTWSGSIREIYASLKTQAEIRRIEYFQEKASLQRPISIQ